MRRFSICVFFVILPVLFLLFAWPGEAEAGKGTLKIGYCQGDSYYEYDAQLYYLIKGMAELGLIPELAEDCGLGADTPSRELWAYISGRDQKNSVVEFVPEAFWSLDLAGARDGLMKENRAQLMITMGTKAGIEVKRIPGKMPQMNFMAADPVGAGVVKGIPSSGTEGVWAQTDPGSFTRSLRVMDDTFQPERLGVVYSSQPDAYIYSGAGELDLFCQKQGIEVKRRYVEDAAGDGDYRDYVTNLRRAHEALASGIDIFILTTSLLKPEDYDYVLQPFYEAGVPVYSINSAADVEYGALMAVESSDYENIGRFGADTLMRYREGTKLEELNQVYQTAPFLVLNYTTAKKTGYRLDFSMLRSASRIYR